jgi:hypothetical protein
MGVGTLAAAAALTLGAGLLPAAAPDAAAACAWRLSAVRLYQELAGETSQRAAELRSLLADSGVGETGFVPESCRNGGDRSPGASSGPGSGSGGSGAGGGTGSGGSAGSSGGGSAGSSSGAGTTAAERFGWGRPDRVSEFNDASELSDWSLYDGPGHAGNGRRTPEAASISDGALTITGDSTGSTAGMAWNPGQKYGRWEGRVRAPASDESYNALLLLWPDAENFPVGGEIDFMEMTDHTRQSTELFLHYGADNSQVHGEVEIDATQWHNWAVEWTPDKITTYIDGEQWWSTTDQSLFPPGPMHLCIQLDWFPKGGDVQESQMHVDWVKQYPLDAAPSPGDSSTGSGSGDPGSSSEENPPSASRDQGSSSSDQGADGSSESAESDSAGSSPDR